MGFFLTKCLRLSYTPTMNIKAFDIVIIAFTACIITLYLFNTISMGNNSSYVKIEVEGKEYLYDINSDLTKTFTGTIGETTVEIHDGSAFITSSDCNNKICIQMGHIHKNGQSIACLPNRILITIEGEDNSDIDAGTY